MYSDCILHEVARCIIFGCEIYSRFHTLIVIKIVSFFIEPLKNKRYHFDKKHYYAICLNHKTDRTK